MNGYNPYNAARSLLGRTVSRKNLRAICGNYGIEADEGATYKELLDKIILQRAKDGDKDAAEIVKEYGLHE